MPVPVMGLDGDKVPNAAPGVAISRALFIGEPIDPMFVVGALTAADVGNIVADNSEIIALTARVTQLEKEVREMRKLATRAKEAGTINL